MLRVPQLDTCVVCEIVRPELGGKLTMLGFMGVCPNVDVGSPKLDQPLVLSFVMSGGPGEGTFMATFDVIDVASDRVVAATGPLPCIALPDARNNFAPALFLVFGSPGRYAARCLVDEREVYRAEFMVSERPFPPEFKRP
jgi:hypothetical protein